MAWAHVQSRVLYDGPSDTTIALAYTGAVAVGSLLVCTVSSNDAGDHTRTATCSDGVNGSWTASPENPVRNNAINGTGWTQWQFYRPNTGAGTPTVTVTFSAACIDQRMTISEYSGIAQSSPLDVSASAIGTSTAPSASDTTTTSNELVYGGGISDSFDIAVNGLTDRGSADGADRVGDKNQAAAGATSVDFTCTSSNWICMLLAFKEPPFVPGSLNAPRSASEGDEGRFNELNVKNWW